MGRTGPLDQVAFRRAYEAHVGFVQFIATKAGWSGAAGDDVVQETFMRFHLHPPDSLEDRAVRAWLATTARRVIVELARKTRHEREAVKDDQATTDGLGFRDTETVERELELLAVRDLIDEIAATPGGEDFRAFYVDGLKAREIADRRGEAVSTVTTRLSRLRQQFRERIVTRLAGVGTRRA